MPVRFKMILAGGERACARLTQFAGQKRLMVLSILWTALIGLYALALYQSRSSLKIISLRNGWALLALCALIILQFLAAGASLAQALSLPKRLSFLEGVRASLVGAVGNYLPMSGGVFARGIYLKRAQDIGYSHYAGTLVCLYLLNVSVSGIFGVVASILSNGDSKLVLLFAVLSTSLLLLYVPIRPGILPYLGRFIAEANAARHNFTKVLIPCSLTIALFMLLQAVGLQLCYLMLGSQIPLSSVVLINSISILVRVFAFAPAGLGVKEILTAGIALSVGIDAEITVLAVGLDRLGTIIASVILWPVLFGFKRM